MEYCNQRWFDLPGSELEARGSTLRDGFEHDAGAVPVNGGILNPVPRPLLPGARLVRFGDVGTVHLTVGGPWWMELAQYLKIEAYADRSGTTVPHALRLFCCVPPEWNSLSIVVQVMVVQPLLAYSGLSAPVWRKKDDRAGPPFLTGGEGKGGQFSQLFIPGMASADLRRAALRIDGYGNLAPST